MGLVMKVIVDNFFQLEGENVSDFIYGCAFTLFGTSLIYLGFVSFAECRLFKYKAQ